MCSVEFFGGLAAESVRSSVVCLSKANQFLHPTIWGTIVSVSVVPVAAFLLLVVFWTGVALFYQIERRLRYIAQRCVLSLMALWYITSVPVIKTTLSVFICVGVYNVLDGTQNDEKIIDTTKEEEISYWAVDTTKEEEISYWAVDTKLKCFEGQHLILVT